jgi:vanillate O-demethylase ferredoxin subunit
MSEAIVMGDSARRRLVGGLFDLADFIAGAGGVFVTLGLNGVAEVEFEFRESFVEALAGEGIEIATSCISGLCGTCKVGYVSGDVEHNDHILGADEQSQCLTACVSRARSGILVLDL